MNKNKGWISLYRSIQDHWLYKEKRKFSKFEAWIDLLMNVNHKDNKILFGNKILEIKRGQVLTSEVKLSKRWDWSRKKVRNFLELLESDEMILKIVIPNRGTVIEILNYDEYQKNTGQDTTVSIGNASIEEGEEQVTTQPKNNRGTTKEQLRNTNNNDNNDNNDNKSSSTTEETEKNNQNDITLIVREFEQNGFGTINFTVKEMIIDLLNEYSTEWIQEAIKIAVKNNKRKLSYVEGILQNWRRNGGMKLGGGSSGENRQDNDEGLGQYKDIGITI